ncbi:unnamed protein product [Caenorhabditis auriculariae]|uniref:Uncharacterized protein n=1 Tax=Caenorhabditis auriculariae TaxID=2777116 RepID=A0A8S1H1D8_9PELO|nr:unnamed protein product [Caenorhabditis auriculariae]
MGSAGSSAHHSSSDLMEHHHQYPDMNMIFKGIPKMIQVADDMHRMTDYIMDLRNMTIGLVAISAVGLIGFLILKAVHGRNNKTRRRRSLARQAEEGYPHNRYYYQSQYSAPEPWDRPKSNYSNHTVDEKRVNETRGSPENKGNGSLPYKPFSNDSSELSPEIEKKSSVVESPFRAMSHKRTLEPVKLVVGDLPYVDS